MMIIRVAYALVMGRPRGCRELSMEMTESMIIVFARDAECGQDTTAVTSSSRGGLTCVVNNNYVGSVRLSAGGTFGVVLHLDGKEETLLMMRRMLYPSGSLHGTEELMVIGVLSENEKQGKRNIIMPRDSFESGVVDPGGLRLPWHGQK